MGLVPAVSLLCAMVAPSRIPSHTWFRLSKGEMGRYPFVPYARLLKG